MLAPYPWTPRDIASSKLTVFPAYADALRVECFGGGSDMPVVTPATTSGQTVGSIICPQDGHVITDTGGGSTNVTLQSDSTGSGVQKRNGFLRLGTASTASFLQVVNSTGAFRFVHTDQCYFIGFWIRMGSTGSIGGDGHVQAILDVIGQSNNGCGFSVWRDSDNFLYVMTNAIASGTQYTLASAGVSYGVKSGGTLTADGNWHFVDFRCYGAGSGCTLDIDATYTPTGYTPSSNHKVGTVAAGANVGTNAARNLCIGRCATGTPLPGNFDIDCLTIASGIPSAADLYNLRNFNPPLNTNSLLRVSTDSARLVPTDISHAWTWHDFTAPISAASGQPLMWTTAAQSTPVTSNTNNIGYVENRTGARLMRYLSLTPGTGSGQWSAYDSGWPTYPTWSTGIGGQPAAYFNGGVDGSTGHSQPNCLVYAQPTPPCDKTWYFVAQILLEGNTDGSGQAGSHLTTYSQETTIYCAVCGRYETSDPETFVEHPAASGTYIAPYSATLSALTFSNSHPATDGTYTYQPGAFFSGNSAPIFYCAATNLWLYQSSSYWYLSPTLGAAAGALTSTNYWATTSQFSPFYGYSAAGTASGSAGAPVGSPSAGSLSPHVYHGRQKGTSFQLGVDGRWGPWITNTSGGASGNFADNGGTAAQYWDSIGLDGHQNAGYVSTLENWPLNAFMNEGAVFLYALPDHVFYGLMRGLQGKYGIPSLYIGN